MVSSPDDGINDPRRFFVINAGPENPTVCTCATVVFPLTVRKSTRKSTLSINSNASKGR